jgi:hypothetical protein
MAHGRPRFSHAQPAHPIVAVQRNPHINTPNPHTITAMMGRSLKDRPGSSCCDADPARVPSDDNRDESGSGLKARSRLALFLEVDLCHRHSDGRLRRRCRVRLRPLFSIEMGSTKALWNVAGASRRAI